MADIFSLFVSRVIKGNRYAQVSAEENDCEWKEDDILKQHLRSTMKIGAESQSHAPSSQPSENKSEFCSQNIRLSSESKMSSSSSIHHIETVTRSESSDSECEVVVQRASQLLVGKFMQEVKLTGDVRHTQNQESHDETLAEETLAEETLAEETTRCLEQQVYVATDKSAIQVGDPSAITNILNDHGINQKINDMKTAVKNRLKRPDQYFPEEVNNNFLSKLKLPNFLNFTEKSDKLSSLETSKDNTVQTYSPKTNK